MTHLYAGSKWVGRGLGGYGVVLTACGLRKPMRDDGRLGADVVVLLGGVTCPSCREKGQAKAQSGKKAS